MPFTDLLKGTGLHLTVASITVWVVVIFLCAVAPRFTDKVMHKPYWQVFLCQFAFVPVIGKPTRGFWRVFVLYIERFL